ncbi:hypothetical protein MPSEU_000412100 [Mayamaea pseudoterrestris]|nr:hypothetical protein MPSEU_000412100 [Mayamaea pseudoterrestris]
MSRHFTLRRLLFLLLVVLAVAIHAQEDEYEENGAVDEGDFDAAEEEHVEPVQEEESFEPEPEPEPEVDPEPEPQHEEAAHVTDEIKSQTHSLKAKLPDFSKHISNIVDSVKVQSKRAVDKVKSISQKDAKKVAAAVVGVWGVGLGIGWLAQQNSKPTVVATGNRLKFKK